MHWTTSAFINAPHLCYDCLETCCRNSDVQAVRVEDEVKKVPVFCKPTDADWPLHRNHLCIENLNNRRNINSVIILTTIIKLMSVRGQQADIYVSYYQFCVKSAKMYMYIQECQWVDERMQKRDDVEQCLQCQWLCDGVAPSTPQEGSVKYSGDTWTRLRRTNWIYSHRDVPDL